MIDFAKVAEEAVARIKTSFSAIPLDDVKIEYDMRLNLGTRMGECAKRGRRRYVISLNPNLFVRTTPEKAVETLRHEIAHAYDDAIVNSFGHGPSWYMLMKLLGYVNPQRCHSVSTVGLKGRGEKTTVWCMNCKRAVAVPLTARDKIIRGLATKRKCAFCGCQQLSPTQL